MNQLEDIFETEEFKKLPWKKRFVIRLKVAFFGFLEMM